MLDGWRLLFRTTSSNSLRKMLMLMCASHLRPAPSARFAFSCLGLRDWEMPILIAEPCDYFVAAPSPTTANGTRMVGRNSAHLVIPNAVRPQFVNGCASEPTPRLRLPSYSRDEKYALSRRHYCGL